MTSTIFRIFKLLVITIKDSTNQNREKRLFFPIKVMKLMNDLLILYILLVFVFKSK